MRTICVVALAAGLAVWASTAHAEASAAGCILALYPRVEDARTLAVPFGEPAADLHLTLVELGNDASDDAYTELLRRLDNFAATSTKAIEAQVFGYAVVNPNSAEFSPSLVYLVGDSPDLIPLRQAVMALSGQLFRLPVQHEPWHAHITAFYGPSNTALTYTGPVVFDRLGLKCGDRITYILL